MKLILLILLTIVSFTATILAYVAFGTKQNAITFILVSFLVGYWCSFFISSENENDASKTNNA
jgi:hypothetical protein